MKKQRKEEEAIRILKKYMKDGDVINVIGHAPLYKIYLIIAYLGIRFAQIKLFGRIKLTYINKLYKYIDKAYKYTHTMLKLNKKIIKEVIGLDKYDKKLVRGDIFSVEPPKACYVSLKEFALKDIAIYRYTKKKLNKDDIKILTEGTAKIYGTGYDYGQLINILINQMLGYGYKEKVKWFDFGAKQKVCSVGISASFLYWVKKIKGIKRLFSILNNNFWSREFIEEFKKNGGYWSIENTYPIMFAITKIAFNNEFELILKMKNGKIQYLKQ